MSTQPSSRAALTLASVLITMTLVGCGNSGKFASRAVTSDLSSVASAPVAVTPAPITATPSTPAPVVTPVPSPAPVTTPTTSPVADSGWVHCANEGERCVVSGAHVVRFGLTGHYNTVTTHQSVQCSAAVFGDPAYGATKTCDVQTAMATMPPATPAPVTPAPATPAATTAPAPTPAPVTAAPKAGALRIQTLGDSITFGYGQTNLNAYRETMVSALTGAGYDVTMVGSMTVGNFAKNATDGHPGWEINDVDQLVTQSHAVTQYAPDLVILMVGTNDFLHNIDAATAPARLDKLIEDIRASVGGVRLIVATVAPAADASVNAKINSYNASVLNLVNAKRAAGQKIYFADINSVLTVNDLVDGVHPNDAGYVKMGMLFQSVIVKNGL